jgi:hypothetical protein
MPPLKIHTWGGLGSQLFAVALAFDAREKFPRRKIKIVLHTGGVTLRLPEVTDLFPGWDYEYVSDFEVSSIESAKKKNATVLQQFKRRFVARAKAVVISSRIIVNCNDDLEYSHLRFWTLACRGHYSYRYVNLNFYELLESALQNCRSIENQEFGDCLTIHYRLGDLLTLDRKNPVSASSIFSESTKLLSVSKFDSLVVLSDSPEVARDVFSRNTLKKLFAPSFNTIEVMSCAISSIYFLGTSSKVSFWIAAIRSSKLKIHSSLPKSNRTQMKYMLGSETELIHYYE